MSNKDKKSLIEKLKKQNKNAPRNLDSKEIEKHLIGDENVKKIIFLF